MNKYVLNQFRLIRDMARDGDPVKAAYYLGELRQELRLELLLLEKIDRREWNQISQFFYNARQAIEDR